jgi:hypothetical protein
MPQKQGGPFILPGTGFPLLRLLPLAGLRWRYSTPPPCRFWLLIYDCTTRGRPIENTPSSIVAKLSLPNPCLALEVFIIAGICLTTHCLTMDMARTTLKTLPTIPFILLRGVFWALPRSESTCQKKLHTPSSIRSLVSTIRPKSAYRILATMSLLQVL